MNLEQPALPFAQKGTVHSRHASYTGAIAARKSRGVKTQLYLQWLRTHGPATDRQVRDALLGAAADMNSVRPRITELVEGGLVVECGEQADRETGRMVRVVRAVHAEETESEL